MTPTTIKELIHELECCALEHGDDTVVGVFCGGHVKSCLMVRHEDRPLGKLRKHFTGLTITGSDQ